MSKKSRWLWFKLVEVKKNGRQDVEIMIMRARSGCCTIHANPYQNVRTEMQSVVTLVVLGCALRVLRERKGARERRGLQMKKRSRTYS